jgi:hypothetical protein
VEYAVEASTIDDGGGGPSAVDGQVVLDVEVAGGAEVLISGAE